MNHYLVLLLGVACAGGGGELFVRGTVGLARWARIPPGIVAATIAAFATSSPEASVAIGSALAGKPQIALGDSLGSNVVNVALILGAALMISGIRSPRSGLKRDFPVALLVPAVTAILFLDGTLSRVDGAILLAVFVAWLVAAVREARRERSVADKVLGATSTGRVLTACAAGLGLLVAAGYLIVAGARGIAAAFGIDEFVIGATVVAVGTSVPELATSIIAKLRGHDEVGLGTIVGSNIFNGSFIVAIAALIHPIILDWKSAFVAIGFGVIALFVSYPDRGGFIERRRGVLLVILYCAYVATVVVGS